MDVKITDIIKLSIEKELPLYSYRKPGQDIITGICINKNVDTKPQPVSITDIVDCYIVVPFNKDKDYYSFKADITIKGKYTDKNTFDTINNIPTTDTCFDYTKNNCLNEDEYISLVGNAIQSIKNEYITKIVYSHAIQKDGKYWACASEIYEKLSTAYPNAYVSLVYIPNNGIWIGATPEVLLQKNGLTIQTMALAGTRAQSDTNAEWDSKNKKEQHIVTRHIIDTLSRFDTQNIDIEKEKTLNAGIVEHLVTHIRFTTQDNTQLNNILSALHPTPAVCGTPQELCYKQIIANEGYDRELYSGYIGYIKDTNDFDLYINLRCMKIVKDCAILFVGGGITKDSIAENEWNETILKSKTLEKILD